MKHQREETTQDIYMGQDRKPVAQMTIEKKEIMTSISIGGIDFRDPVFRGSFIDESGVLHKRYTVESPDENQRPVIYDVRVDQPFDKKDSEIPTRYSVSTSFRTLLHDTHLGDVSKRTRELIFCFLDDTILSAYNKLIAHGVLCLPVTNEEHNKFFGFVDILDILTFVNDNIYPKVPRRNTETKELEFKIGDRVKKLAENNRDFIHGQVSNITKKRIIVIWDDKSHSNYGFESKLLMHENTVLDEKQYKHWYDIEEIYSTKCRDIINFSKRNSSVFKSFNDPIQTIIDDGVFKEHHRVALMDKEKVVAILTQSNLLDFLFSNRLWSELGNIARHTVWDLKLGIRPVHSVTTSITVYSAYRKLIDEKVSALAVLGARGKLIGTLSVRDIKKMGYDMELFDGLFDTVGELLNRKMTAESEPVTAYLDTQFSEILKVFHEKKVHHVFVADNKNSLLGIITPPDIFRCLRSKHAMEVEENKTAQVSGV